MKKILLSLLAVGTLFSCGDFDEINTDPDQPTVVTPEFLATNVILKTTESSTGKWFWQHSWLMKTSLSTEHLESYLYNKFERTDFSRYGWLTDARKMLEFAEADETMPEEGKNAYRALNLFIRAFAFYQTTMEMGDIPCSEAIMAESDGIFSPKYDTQEEVFTTILNDLREASSLFQNAAAFSGDPIYNGDPTLWLKNVNSFTLRVLNMLSEKETVGSIRVRDLFEQVAKEPLMENEGESYQRVYDSSKSAQWYPFYFEVQNYWSYPVMSSFLIDMLKDLEDRRLFYYAEPAPIHENDPADSYDSYSGVNPVLDYGTVQAEFTEGLHSHFNERYHLVPEGEPVRFISYSEIQFILAEAALRGWSTPASAEQHYNNAVRATMQFTFENTPEAYRHGVVIDDAYIDAYLNGKAKFDPANGLEQIMNQKMIAGFGQSDFNNYYDYRRTGFPRIPIDPTTNMNEVNTQLPLRWMYPESEYSQNRENIEAAIDRQFGGSDTPNEVMWLLK